ncbi:MAG: HAD hydrolase-like protein [Candidatus Mariimomonas ferrooxydans]
MLNVLRKKDAVLGLLTGNLEQGAKIKLKAFNLNEYFLVGAFGSDHEDRDRLLPVALEKFSRRGLSFSLGDCIVVGDTPLDVQCARIHGARCLAVATGPYTKEQLLNTDADIVFDTLEDIERCMKFIME